jgi:thymidylate kinase
MPLIYVTGVSGSGKSSVLGELQKRRFAAHGVDEEGYADWIDRETDAIIPFPSDEASANIHDWYKKHRWVLSKARISGLKEQSEKEGKTTFLIGYADDEDDIRHLFDKVILLSIDEVTMRSRIKERENSHFGKAPEEMADILIWLKNNNEDSYRRAGAFVIDATRPLNEVVDNIVEIGMKEPNV